MCGYCAEETYAINFVYKESEGKFIEPGEVFAPHYFQEISDLKAGIDEAVKYAERKLTEEEPEDAIHKEYYVWDPDGKGKIVKGHIQFPRDIWDLLPREVIFCRMLDLLIDQGVESETFQTLIANPYISKIIDHQCGPALRKEFETLRVPFPLDDHVCLYDPETFRSKSKWTDFIEKGLPEQCKVSVRGTPSFSRL